MCMARRFSRHGCSTVSASSSAMTSRCRPASKSASMRASRAARRTSSSRVVSASRAPCASTSAYGCPRHIANAARSSGRGAVGIRHRRRRLVGLLELDAVDVAAGERQHVGVALAHDDIAEHVAQVRHVGLQRATATQRSLLAVHRLEQHVHRHRASSRGDQHRNHYPLLRTAQRERNSVDEDFQRAKDPIVHRENVLLIPALKGGNLHRAHRERPASRSAQALDRFLTCRADHRVRPGLEPDRQ